MTFQTRNALYQLFTSTVFFPDALFEMYYRALCDLGYAEEVHQGHVIGYRITPEGYAIACARWGHEQQ